MNDSTSCGERGMMLDDVRCVTPSVLTLPEHGDGKKSTDFVNFSPSTTEQEAAEAEHSYTDFLQDAEIIREQARILEQIQEEQRRNLRHQEQIQRPLNEGSNPTCSSIAHGSGGGRTATEEEHLGSFFPSNDHPDQQSPSGTTLRDYAWDTTDRLNRQVASYTATRSASRDVTESSPPCVVTNSGVRKNPSAAFARSCHSAPAHAAASTESAATRPAARASAGMMSKNQGTLKGSTSPSTSMLRGHHQAQDQVVKVGHKNLRLKGTNQTYDAIARGNAVILQCPTCATILQVSSTAKLLYCVICQNVTPVHLARDRAVVNPTANGTTNVDASGTNHRHPDESTLSTLDSQIARILQNQEMDIACARKLAASSNVRTASSSNTSQGNGSPGDMNK
jgi:hypothetical protein